MARRPTHQVGKYKLGKLGKQWVVYWDDGDKRPRHRIGKIGEIDGPATLSRFAREQERLTRADAKTIDDIMTAYLKDLKDDKRPSHPITEHYWKALKPAFGHLTPEMITKQICQDYRKDRRKKGIKDGTILTELARLRSAFAFAVRDKMLKSAPHVWLPPAPRPKDRWLTREEATKLIDGARMPHVRLFIILALATAGRAQAILDLTWDRVDFINGIIYLDDPERDRTNKGRANVPMNSMARAALTEAKEGALTEFVIEHGARPVKSIKKGIKAAAERAGLKDVSPHVLRHSALTWMAMDGVPIAEISKYAGHGNIMTTQKTYLHHTPGYLSAASESVNLKLVRKVV